MWSKLTKGNKIIGPAGAVAFICFFMPWVLVSCENQPVASFTGAQLAAGGRIGSGLGAQPLQGSPELFLVLLAAIGCIALVFLVYRGRMAVRRAAMAAIGLATVSLLLMLAKFAGAPAQTSQMGASIRLDLEYGFWGVVLANLAIIGGAIADLRGPAERPMLAPVDVPVAGERAYDPVATTGPLPAQSAQMVVCPSCGLNQAAANFCAACGARLDAQAS